MNIALTNEQVDRIRDFAFHCGRMGMDIERLMMDASTQNPMTVNKDALEGMTNKLGELYQLLKDTVATVK